jgi:hypothetical protein
MQGACPPDGQSEDDKPVRGGLCQCLSQCSTCDRCAEPWVVIAVLQIDSNGIVDGSIGDQKLVDEEGGPVRIKPIECLCSSESNAADRLEQLESRIKELAEGGPRQKSSKETAKGKPS